MASHEEVVRTRYHTGVADPDPSRLWIADLRLPRPAG
jgi:hypothetical protein